MKKSALFLVLSALMVSACDESSKPECLESEHIYKDKCRADDVNHCGKHTIDCTKAAGWKSGSCIDKTCFAEECKIGYHLANIIDKDNKERTACEEDTHDACGSITIQCREDQVCTQGECTDICGPNEVYCSSDDAKPTCMPEDQLKSDPFHCGKCDKKCETNELCQDSQCIISTCTNNECLFNNACINQDDHCGIQCVNCNTANHASAGVCKEGSCSITSCVSGYNLYDNACEADSITDCGKHGRQCNVENAANTCSDGDCTFTCNDGYELIYNVCKLANPLITKWNVTSDNMTITLPILEKSDTLVIDWGDGEKETFSSEENNYHHTYSTEALYTIKVTGTINHWTCSFLGSCSQLVSIQSYGNTTFGDYAFSNAAQLESLPTQGTPRFKNNRMKAVFYGASKFNQDISFWDTSNITVMSGMFYDAASFNQPLNSWNVSNVTDMHAMFYSAKSFNQPLNNWDTSSVTDMSGMFAVAEAFNQPLDNWDTSSVTNMSMMFQQADSFDQSLNGWDVSNVTDMNLMFMMATKFNHPIDTWTPSNVTNMSRMFEKATAFNQSINGWDVSKVTDMNRMFWEATAFNQPLNNWDISSVTSIGYMFGNATSFDQPLDNWNVSNLTTGGYLFHFSGLTKTNYCKLFTGPYASAWTNIKSTLGMVHDYKCP